MTEELDLKKYIREIPDFPKPGILFRDITPLLAEPKAFQEVIDRLTAYYRDKQITAVLAAEARGFIFAAPLALALGARFIPIRKPGKLPFETKAFHYELEYGSDSLEMHTDSIHSDDRVLIVDDLLATGGTIAACIELTKHSQAEVVSCAFLIELAFLKGREKMNGCDVYSLIHYAAE
ncbi:MAG TPA: adenine phosphoribosyltransferase [Planctomycetaceae bacterium]|jgi:adenine phosphoribosyltransferase|uniref:Adenine phosphoribosyltransferase n=1 Tax=Gimesia maris TaxID=122 RepID=A0A3D3R002_9PLAN|nr:adenine phosphoribosyltransferase [Gimesia sp.]HAW29788.1 adenine phosphoribosyltransferase [Planctomycetaceae bacterium]HCO22163.1 adenine phosphoribosyltransferase [Gimesia maris]|tara:strand:+ start:1978 stop:2511 length:534 start_codon:yes stop_codon:yes gene_type:complete